jgi:hypothetical protein
MGSRLKNIGLIGLGMVAGAAGSMQFSAMAQKNSVGPLPLEELRQLSDVFGLIKSDYVEPDRRPQAARRRRSPAWSMRSTRIRPTWTRRHTANCAKARKANSSASASRSARAMKVTSRSSRPDRGLAGLARGHQGRAT